MKFTTFFFSGTGNTWWIAKQFTDIALQKGHHAEYLSIENENVNKLTFLEEKLKNTDALGIAYPIYGSTAPYIVWDFMERLISISKSTLMGDKRLKNTKDGLPDPIREKVGYVLTSMAMFSGDGALILRKKMKNLGFPILGAINIKLASNISVPGFHLDPVNEEKLAKRKRKAKEKISKFFERIEAGDKKLEGRWNILGKIGGIGQRIFMDWALNRLLNFSVDRDTCIECMKCVNNCPTESIYFENDEFEFEDNCTYCMRCYNFCPSYAIKINDKKCDPEKYLRYQGPTEDFKLKKLTS
ncbi:MAG: hypothetical protein GF383_10840 [Candidatus Lokiarchaeota archaeon]|nr:hypothetical protein [Candidatus Lokiarchaeota archaeon]MBD3341100.1 hypothetical protein [Candidatus Lokiarchaeota archaeon]